ncbi:bifunctional diaminohydroxyphosphoribosylaminopyrimidine deaminase/5-amino-6-(5-phosphoribosylamino)uracil reductase RibD [Leuconostoc sp. MS02]|uniref:Riboflavin biosynthesis protein RibD n=1 Tax=Leuconostoc aquikimchii TaxID=3236804 RepID=A0ABV3S4Q3_9LACO
MNDLTLMSLAAEYAAKARPENTFENPRVGAIIVKNDQILSTGFHKAYGMPHAEIDAFNHLRDKDSVVGATMYVTLEPCAVRGKVGSCAEEIKQWQLSRIVIGASDPNPTTHGKGIALLRQAGIQVDILNTQDSIRLNPAFHHYFQQNESYVQLKLAQSHNERVTVAPNVQTKITNQVADVEIHRQRGSKSAILVGSETVIVDAPSLNVRYISITHRQPLRVVIDRRGRLINNQLINKQGWLVYTENQAFSEREPNAVLMTAGLPGILKDLKNRNMQSIMVEGGPTMIKSFLKLNLWHQFIMYTSEQLLPDNGVNGLHLDQVPDHTSYVGNTKKTVYINHRRPSCLQE